MKHTMRNDEIPARVKDLCRTLRDRGHGAWVVGGCVRDHLLGRAVNDWDVCTSALPDDVVKIFPRTIPTGIAHGTVTVMLGKEGFEVTTLRGEGAYSDGRRPDSVFYVDDITADLARRDFTVNAIAYDPLEDKLVDPHGGIPDLTARVLRAVGNPRERFGEDGLRVLRAARFVAALEFALEPETEAAIGPSLDTFRKVSTERVHDEWVKAMKAREPSRAFLVMLRTGILAVTAPGLAGLNANAFHASITAMDAIPPGDAPLRLAALVHPLGADETDKLLRALKFSNDDRARVVHLVRWHAVDDPSLRDAALRIYLSKLLKTADDADRSLRLLEDWSTVSLAVARANGRDGTALTDLAVRAKETVRSGVPLHPRQMAVTGNDLQSELGVPPSKRLGVMLATLFDRVLEDPSRNTKPQLLEIARGLP